MSTKKIIFIIIGIILFIGLAYILELQNTKNRGFTLPSYLTKEQEKNEAADYINQTNTHEIDLTQKTETGAAVSKMSDEEIKSSNQFAKLRSSLPIDNEIFTMNKFNYTTFKITVTFKNTQIENKQQLLDEWLKNNGYESVEKKYFDIK